MIFSRARRYLRVFFGLGSTSGRRSRQRQGLTSGMILRSLFTKLHLERDSDRNPPDVSCEACQGTGAKPGTYPSSCPIMPGNGADYPVTRVFQHQHDMRSLSRCGPDHSIALQGMSWHGKSSKGEENRAEIPPAWIQARSSESGRG